MEKTDCRAIWEVQQMEIYVRWKWDILPEGAGSLVEEYEEWTKNYSVLYSMTGTYNKGLKVAKD